MAWEVEGLGRFQPTPLHEERRLMRRSRGGIAHISTHAPARGATVGHYSGTRSVCNFNPRPCTRSDKRQRQRSTSTTEISTHAPARGATVRCSNCTATDIVFQPTPLHEERLNVVRLARARGYFNPRPCTRSDARLAATKEADASYFNPRPCTRSDPGLRVPVGLQLVFQPTPLHEERQDHATMNIITSIISTHAPARGATPIHFPAPLTSLISTHAPARGATGTRKQQAEPDDYFNPRPCTRSDTAVARGPGGGGDFNPRPCTRSDP